MFNYIDMKILWFTNTPSLYPNGKRNCYHGGGWISSLEQLIRKNSGIELHIAFYSGDVDEIVYDKVDGVNYILIPCIKKSIGFKISQFLGTPSKSAEQDKRLVMGNLMEVVNKVKPDAIQVFGSENKFGLISKYTDIPLVLHIQGVLAPCLNAFLPPGMNWKDYVWKPFSVKGVLARISEKYAWHKNVLIEQEIYRHVRYVFGRTDWDRHVMSILAPQARYIHCDEILRSWFYEASEIKRKLPDKARFVSIISYPTYKGMDLVLKTANVLKSYTDLEFEWDVYGIASAEYAERLTGVSASNVNVNLRGTATPEQLIESLKKCTSYVHPSYIENSCVSIAEAQMLGVLTIAVGVGGIGTLIKDFQTGILVPSNDPFEMAYQMKWAYTHPVENIHIGQNARKSALERHDKGRIAKIVCETYESIAKKDHA